MTALQVQRLGVRCVDLLPYSIIKHRTNLFVSRRAVAKATAQKTALGVADELHAPNALVGAVRAQPPPAPREQVALLPAPPPAP